MALPPDFRIAVFTEQVVETQGKAGRRTDRSESGEGLKKKKGQNRNSAPFKIQYPMKNQDESKGGFLIKQ